MSEIYACILHNIYMSEIYECQKICLSEIHVCQKYIHVRNIFMLEIYARIFRNISMYFQKHMATKSGVQIFLVRVV